MKRLLADRRAGRADLDSPLLDLRLVVSECRRLHLPESPEGRWQALRALLDATLLEETAQAAGLPTQKLQVIADLGGAELFELLRQAYAAYERQPQRLAWLYLYVHFISPRLQHRVLELRVRGPGSKDLNHFWNDLKNNLAVPALTRKLVQKEGAARSSQGAGSAALSSLPAPEGELIGRRHSRQRAREALRDGALLTLTGPGGVGKTSLALSLAWELAARFPDGVHWLELGRVSEASLLHARLWQQLSGGRSLPTDPVDGLVHLLQGQRTLLVLDNCEHLLPEAADLAERLLEAGAGLRVLATSRVPLKLSQEQVLRLRGLSVPPLDRGEDLAGYEAVRAFAQEAQRNHPDFALNAATTPQVAAIVRRVEGLPLALKLLAPWTRYLSLDEILANLDSLTLRGADRDRRLPERHRSLGACLAWSLDRLEEKQRDVFIQLAVFSGGWTTEAARAVCRVDGRPMDASEAIDLLLRLVDLSLVEVDSSGCRSRARLLEPLREEGARLLDRREDAAAVRERHAHYFLELAEAADAERAERGGSAWLAALDAEQSNLRAAAQWARENDRLEITLRLAAALWRHQLRQGLGGEARDTLEWGLAQAGFHELPKEVQARILNAAAGLALLSDRVEAAAQYLEAALELLEGSSFQRLRMTVLYNLGSLRGARGEVQAAAHYYEAAMAIKGGGFERWRALTARNLALLMLHEGDIQQALVWLDQAEATFRRKEDGFDLALTLAQRGQCEFLRGNGAMARCILAEAVAFFRADGDRRRELETLNFLANAAQEDLEPEAAAAALERAAALAATADDPANAIKTAVLQARSELLAGDALSAAESLRRLRLRVADDTEEAYLALIEAEHAWALAALGRQEDRARVAIQALRHGAGQGQMRADQLATLEAYASSRNDDRALRWLAELARLRSIAGLPRSALQAERLGTAAGSDSDAEAGGAVSGEGVDAAADWRAALERLAEEMVQAAGLEGRTAKARNIGS